MIKTILFISVMTISSLATGHENKCLDGERPYWHQITDTYGRASELNDALAGCNQGLEIEMSELVSLCETQYPGSVLRPDVASCAEDNCRYYGFPFYGYVCRSEVPVSCCK